MKFVLLKSTCNYSNDILYDGKLFMAHKAIPIVAFHMVGIYNNYIFLRHDTIHVVYIVKEVASFWEGGSVNEWVWCVIEQALELYRPVGSKLLVVYIENGSTS